MKSEIKEIIKGLHGLKDSSKPEKTINQFIKEGKQELLIELAYALEYECEGKGIESFWLEEIFNYIIKELALNKGIENAEAAVIIIREIIVILPS